MQDGQFDIAHMSSLPASDVQLIRGMTLGSADAFSQIYERYSGNVYRFALQATGSPDAAKDVTQETFLFLMRSANGYKSEKGPLLGWLLGVTRNIARRSGRNSREEDSLSDQEPAAESFDVFDTLTRTETIQSVRDAIQALPASYREVVALCELQELDYQQAATVLGCPIGTVRSRLHRARRILLSKLQAFSCV